MCRDSTKDWSEMCSSIGHCDLQQKVQTMLAIYPIIHDKIPYYDEYVSKVRWLAARKVSIQLKVILQDSAPLLLSFIQQTRLSIPIVYCDIVCIGHIFGYNPEITQLLLALPSFCQQLVD